MASKKTDILTRNFFNDLIEGKFTSADKTLQTMKAEMRSTERQKGYLNALEGMLSALASKSDKAVLINQITAKEADKLAKVFARRSKDKLQNEFDRGFFEAWVDYAKTLKNTPQTQLKI